MAKPRDIILGLVHQFAYWSDSLGGFHTGGLSALEEAFDFLGWGDPHPSQEDRCDEPGCLKRGNCGSPFPDGRYRWTCYDHSNLKKETDFARDPGQGT